ncbi:MAG: hypothetical protein NW217_03715 [Hyphomicrobiaceae bacterium]|nr:hypothetical protein [Hyphomicrobiaceae bacterium]
MKVTRRDFVVGSLAASAMPIGGVSVVEMSAETVREPSRIEGDLKILQALRTKAYRAFVMEGRIGEIVHLRRETLRRLGYSLSFEAGTDEERQSFREAAAFLAKLENSAIWLPWNRRAWERCVQLRERAEAGGQLPWRKARQVHLAVRGDCRPEKVT